MAKFALFGAMAMAATIGLGAMTAMAEPPPAVDDPEAFLDEREQFFRGMGGAIRNLGGYAQGRGPTAEQAAEAAALILASAKELPSMFPPNTAVGVGDSEALPVIWEDWDGFLEKSVALEEAAQAANDALAAGAGVDEVGPLVRAVGGTCGSCHDSYRVED